MTVRTCDIAVHTERGSVVKAMKLIYTDVAHWFCDDRMECQTSDKPSLKTLKKIFK